MAETPDKAPETPHTPKPRYRKKPLWFRLCKYFMVFVLTIVIVGLLAGFIGFGTVAGLVASLVKDQPIPSKEEMAADIMESWQTSYIYDRNGKPIGSGELRTANDRVLVELKNVSPYIIDAFISTEDKEFYEHDGIVPRSLMRAAAQDLAGSAVSTGGSTITQQLVKLAVLKDTDQTYSRKAKEIFLALRLDRLFEKEDILKSYLNQIYFGQGASKEHMYGIEAAAKGIFGVSAKDVNIAQAAYLAGMPQQPNGYNPFKKDTLKEGLKRQRTVLDRMLANGKLTAKQYEEAKAFNIKKSLTKAKPYVYEQYPYLYEAIQLRVAEKLMELDGYKLKELEPEKYNELLEQYKTRAAEGGYRVHTTVDLKLYDAINESVETYEHYKPEMKVSVPGIKGKLSAKEQIGSVVVENKSGAILAFVGGRDKKNIQNRALDSRKQPGSTMKPLLAYAPALDAGVLQPGSVLEDNAKAAQVTSGYKVNNFDHSFSAGGRTTVRRALEWSLNVPAVDAFYRKLGVENGYKFLAKLNMPVPPEEQVVSGVLGSNVFTPEQMAGAYATFGNNGKFHKTYLISRIENAEGKVIYEHTVKGEQVMSPSASYMLTDMLRGVVRKGTASGTVGPNVSGAFDVAGKTGTAEYEKDVYFVGYTPEITISVWAGYDYEKSDPFLKPDQNLAMIMWTRFFHAIQKTQPTLSPPGSRFAHPRDLVSVEICKITGKRATAACRSHKETVTELFQVGQVPKEECDYHNKKKKGRTVKFKGSTYIANDKTPDDMVIRGDVSDPDIKEDPRTSEGTPRAPHISGSGGSVSWGHTGQESVVGYRVYRSTDGQKFSKVASIRLDQSTGYSGDANAKYLVKAVDVVGIESAPSNVVGNISQKPPKEEKPDKPDKPGKPDKPNKPAKPSAPIGLSGQFTGNSVNLRWQPSGNGSVNQYLIFMNDGSGFKQIAAVGGTGYTHAGSFTGTRSYYVVAINDAGRSGQSNTIQVTGKQQQAPPPPDKDNKDKKDGAPPKKDKDGTSGDKDKQASGNTVYSDFPRELFLIALLLQL